MVDVELEELGVRDLIVNLRIGTLTFVELDLLNTLNKLTLCKLLFWGQQVIDRDVQSTKAANMGNIDV